MNALGQFIEAIAPAFTGENVVESFDNRVHFKGMRSLRAELPKVLGAAWNKRQYTAKDMLELSSNQQLSPDARAAAAHLGSPEGSQRLDRINNLQGAKDGKFRVQDLEAENNVVLGERRATVQNADKIAQQELESTVRSLSEKYKSVVEGVVTQNNAAFEPLLSTRLD